MPKAEVRGRGRRWKVLYSDPSGMPTTHPIYDGDGNLKGVVQSAGPTGKMIEANAEFTTKEEAIEYARYLGFTEIEVNRTRTRNETLRIARDLKKKKGGAA